MRAQHLLFLLAAFLILFSPPVEAQRRVAHNPAKFGESSPVRTITLRGVVRSEQYSAPLSMIRVELSRFGGGQIATTFTNSEGSFTFFNVPAESYQISINQDGYAPLQETVQVFGEMDVTGLILFLKELPGRPPGAPGAMVSAKELALPPKVKKDYGQGLAALYEKRKPEASLVFFARVIEQAPEFFQAYHHSGIAYLRLSRFPEAETILRKALALNPERPGETQTALASALVSLNRSSEAEPLARQGLAAYPASWLANYVLARALVSLNRTEEAEKLIQESLRLNPSLPQAYLLLATVHINRNDTASLVKDLDNFLRLDPKGPQSDAARKMLEQARQDQAVTKSSVAPAAHPQ
jgi:tetratricopeptide (TPR) repeat protein